MRWDLLLAVVATSLVATGCGEAVEARSWTDGTLVLEVGGPQASLRADLAAAGVSVDAPHLLKTPEERSQATERERSASGDVPTAGKPGPSTSSPVDDEAREPPVPFTEVAPPPSAAYFTVPLGEGRTLVHLAKKYLGNGNRYQELLELNGWSLEQAKRLKVTQLVKIPVDPAQAGQDPPR